MSFAKAVITGTLVAEPEKRFTPNNHAVTTLTLAVENGGGFSRAGNNDPFLVKVTCWRGIAEAVAEQLRKDDTVLVEGKLQINSYQTQDGTQKKSFELEAITVDKLPGKPEPMLAPAAGASVGNAAPTNNSGLYPEPVSVGAPTVTAQPASHFSSEDMLTEDDIPF